ncbi:MAG: 50S ribosomal protein L28 [Bdellovibrionales bacterium]
MARVCAVTGKTVRFGNNVSHSNRKTRRRWQPNLQVVSMPSEALGRTVSLRISANALRTIEHNGGIDAFLRTAKTAALSTEAKALKKQVMAADAKAKA